METGGEHKVPGDTVGPAPIPSGGAFAALDPSNPKDAATVRRAIKCWPKRWRGLTDTAKDAFVEGMIEAQETARRLLKAEDAELALKAAAAIGSLTKTAVAMEGQVQADDHLQDKNERIDGGKATDAIKLYGTSVDTEAV